MNLNCVLGFTSTEVVLLDFDDTDLDLVIQYARKAMKLFDLGGFLVLESSRCCFHVVFNRWVDWRENMKVVAWAILRSHNLGLSRWQLMQCRKGSSTLRVSEKYWVESSPPWIVYGEGEHDEGIDDYLFYRDLLRCAHKHKMEERASASAYAA
ncbi:hypothetical protein ACFL0D_04910 [Thermoproteota archaeon]